MTEAWWWEVWSRRTGWSHWLLRPVSALYALLLDLRWRLYQMGWLQQTQLPVPVLVVGNVLIGGVGKTPVTIEIVNHLLRQGWRVGVLSRGHGRANRKAWVVNTQSVALEVGDEPLLIQRRTGVPVAVAACRVHAGRLLLRQHPELDLLVCDDGLQHLALKHDLAVCVFDDRFLGNAHLLPAGPLRERWPRKTLSQVPTWLLSSCETCPDWAWPVRRRLATQAVNGLGQHCHLSDLPEPIYALAAIARPEVFFHALRQYGLHLTLTQAWADHSRMTDWQPIPHGSWVCTEKDAVKIWPHHPQIWAVPLEVEIPTALLNQICTQLRDQLSSNHGQETT